VREKGRRIRLQGSIGSACNRFWVSAPGVGIGLKRRLTGKTS